MSSLTIEQLGGGKPITQSDLLLSSLRIDYLVAEAVEQTSTVGSRI
jgi:hypothetical protein